LNFYPQYKREDIDPLMWELINDLNDNKFFTCACCQGRRTVEEFKKKQHCPEAYIFFLNDITKIIPGEAYKPVSVVPNEVCTIASAIGLNVFGSAASGGVGIHSIKVTTPPAEPGSVVGYKPPNWRGYMAEKWTFESQCRVIEANEVFIGKIRKAFNLKRNRDG
jgi:hypothetical protein